MLFTVAVIGLGQAYSWASGYEDEVKTWTSANRPLVAIVLVLSAVVYAMYDWLEDKER